MSMIAASIAGRSSGTTAYSDAHGEATASAKNPRMAGPLRSSYTPPLARSLTVSTPKRAASPTPPGAPPARGAAAAAAMPRPLAAGRPWMGGET
jgi:hypothetical protein